eukprot:Skav232611  [mRNA]  locus=scaffold1224:520771:528840:+ [translate_table: standard]
MKGTSPGSNDSFDSLEATRESLAVKRVFIFSKHDIRLSGWLLADWPRVPKEKRAEESPSPCPSSHSMPAALFGSGSSKSIRKWGIGSSPRRCPKLGTPTRKAQVDGDLLLSPTRVRVQVAQTSPIRRRLGGFTVPESLAARVPKLPRRSEGWGSPLR